MKECAGRSNTERPNVYPAHLIRCGNVFSAHYAPTKNPLIAYKWEQLNRHSPKGSVKTHFSCIISTNRMGYADT